MYGLFTYIYHKKQLNVGKYTSPMDPLGSRVTLTPALTFWHSQVCWKSSFHGR